MNTEDTLSLYEEMTVISGQMLRAASEGEWDLLTELERECASRIDRLRQNETVVVQAEQRSRKVAAIRTILANDRQIRDLTQPWMAKLSALVGNTSTERRVARAYGV